MPLYEYECTACHRRTEKILKFSDADLTVCPHCGGPLERTITAPNVQFKGGGWYKDLYSSVKPASNSGGSAASESGSNGADSNAAESKSSEPKSSEPKPSGGGESSKSADTSSAPSTAGAGSSSAPATVSGPATAAKS